MKKIAVEYDMKGRTFNYNGNFISMGEKFLVMDDSKEGRLHLNVDNILKIQEVDLNVD